MVDKENMQNTIKSLQERSQNIEKLLEKGDDVIVLQLSSHSIKMNFANQGQPIRIRNIVAYKSKVQKDSKEAKEAKEVKKGRIGGFWGNFRFFLEFGKYFDEFCCIFWNLQDFIGI